MVICRLIEKDSKGWRKKRERKLKELAPMFAVRGYKAAFDKLVDRVRLPYVVH